VRASALLDDLCGRRQRDRRGRSRKATQGNGDRPGSVYLRRSCSHACMAAVASRLSARSEPISAAAETWEEVTVTVTPEAGWRCRLARRVLCDVARIEVRVAAEVPVLRFKEGRDGVNGMIPFPVSRCSHSGEADGAARKGLRALPRTDRAGRGVLTGNMRRARDCAPYRGRGVGLGDGRVGARAVVRSTAPPRAGAGLSRRWNLGRIGVAGRRSRATTACLGRSWRRPRRRRRGG